jgi:site-specific recombinase XerD
LSKAAIGFLQYKEAEGLSPHTLGAYKDHLARSVEYIGDVPVNRVTTQQIRAFLVWLRTDYKPRRLTGGCPTSPIPRNRCLPT